jgi:hypothetical protein
MAPFYQLTAQYLGKLGVLDVIIPFIFAFTIVYALISKINIFGDNSRKYGAVIALVSGLVFVSFVNFTDVILFSSYIAILLIAGLMVMLLMNFFNVESLPLKWGGTIVGIAFVLIFGYSYIDWDVIKDVLLNPATISTALLIIGIWFVVREKKPEEKKAKEKAKPAEELEETMRTPGYPKQPVLLEEKQPFFRRK